MYNIMRLMMFENMMLRGIFGPRRDEITRNWRKGYYEFPNLCSSPSIIKMFKIQRRGWARHISQMRKRKMKNKRIRRGG
jgi:hypothetical protein